MSEYLDISYAISILAFLKYKIPCNILIFWIFQILLIYKNNLLTLIKTDNCYCAEYLNRIL